MRTILADGRPMIREGLRHLVESHFPQCELFETSSLTESLRTMVDRHPIRLAVLDLGMPGMNGFQGVSAVRRLFPEIRCVVISAAEGDDLAGEAMRLGAHGFVPMHLAPTALVTAIGQAMVGERFVPPGPHDAVRADIVARLTPRERDIMKLLTEGLPNKVIANKLAVSEVTVKSHLGNVFRKLGVQNRLQAMRMIVETRSLR